MPITSRAAAIIVLLFCGIAVAVLIQHYPPPVSVAPVPARALITSSQSSGSSGSKAAPAGAASQAPASAIESPQPTAGADSTGNTTGATLVTGRVLFSGKEPEMPEINVGSVPDCAKLHKDPVYDDSVVINPNKTLANVVVWISAGLPAGQSYPLPSTPMILDQRGCLYHPHVNACMTGQDVIIRSSDMFLHNIHALCTENPPFNFAQPTPSDKKIDPFKVPEVFSVKCDVHPWMHSYIHVFDHPFFDVTHNKGTYSIANLPPGTYTVKAWQEKFGEQEQQVQVQPGKPANVNFTFQAK